MSDERNEESASQPRLSNKRKQFVIEYLRDFNATQAAIRAGYSARTAYSIGSEILNIPEVADAIKTAIAERAMGADEVLLRLAQMARGDLADFMRIGPLGFDIDLDAAREVGLTHLIKKVRQRTTVNLNKDGGETEVHDLELELYDAQAALVHLGRHLGLFKDNLDVNVKGSISHTFEEMLKRTYADDSGDG